MIVSQIVDRLHVGTSDLAVLRYMRSRMDKKSRTDPSLREARKQVYRQALAAHRANQETYAFVMRGGF